MPGSSSQEYFNINFGRSESGSRGREASSWVVLRSETKKKGVKAAARYGRETFYRAGKISALAGRGGGGGVTHGVFTRDGDCFAFKEPAGRVVNANAYAIGST